MKAQLIALTVASLSIAMTCAAMLPAHAGIFHKEYWSVNAQNNQNNLIEKIGEVEFDWNDSVVVNGQITGYNNLTRFLYTDKSGSTYDKTFALFGAPFKAFTFNISTEQVLAYAYKVNDPNSLSGYTGFWVDFINSTPIGPSTGNLLLGNVVPTFNTAGQVLPVKAAQTPASIISPQSVPEPSSVVALLGIVGLGGMSMSILKR